MNSERPLIVVGNGIRLAGEKDRFTDTVQRWRIPFVTTWTGADLFPTADPLNTGILGMCGQPGANKAVQECDYLLAVGTHLAIPHTTTLTALFAPKAKIVCINIDDNQLENMNVLVNPYCIGVKEWLDDYRGLPVYDDISPWRARCAELKLLNAIGNPQTSYGINSYVFNEIMTQMLPFGTCMVIDGGGTALYTGFQSSHVKAGSRLICSTAVSAMGSGLPEAIGACFANNKRLTTCLIGDGSLMLNMQELQTIAHHKLPIKIFVINNNGYRAIKDTQDGFLEGRHTGVGGSDDESLSFTDVSRLAAAFHIPYIKLDKREGAEEVIGVALDSEGPAICEVICPEDQQMRWKQAFKREGGKFVPQTLDVMQESV